MRRIITGVGLLCVALLVGGPASGVIVIGGPTVEMLVGAGSVPEGSSVVVQAVVQDATGAVTYAWALNGDGVLAPLGDGASALFTGIDGVDPAVATSVGVKITDSLGQTAVGASGVTVNNVAPAVGAISGPVDPVPVGVQVNFSADFTDPGVLDTHTAEWDWGDESTAPGTVEVVEVVPGRLSGSVSGSHAYTAAGVYTVKLTVTDKDGGVGTAVCQNYVVVYNPGAGFVTGGGWINAPPGAVPTAPALIGKATYGFNAKYKPGATVPDGQTEFQFHKGLNFHSTSYDWLAVLGCEAYYLGSGTVNGVGDYGFVVSLVDGRLAPDGIDRYRMRIWDKATGAVVFDNQFGHDVCARAAQPTDGGSLVIHAK